MTTPKTPMTDLSGNWRLNDLAIGFAVQRNPDNLVLS